MPLYRNTISRFGLVALLSALPVLIHADPRALDDWGKQVLAQKNYPGAIKYFSAAMKADPRDAGAYCGIGYAYLGLHDRKHGIQYLEYALRLDPSNHGLRVYLAGIYQDYGNDDYKQADKIHAREWWDKALALNPGNTRLAAYVAQTRGGTTAPITVAAEPASATASAAASAAPKGETLRSAPSINPWIMGGTVVALGAILIFLF
jgi:tetratricopeptide (TPR) repeat protein